LVVSLKGGWLPHNNTDFPFLIAVRFISILISLNIVFLIVFLLIVFLPIQFIFFNRWMLMFFLYCKKLTPQEGGRSPNSFWKCEQKPTRKKIFWEPGEAVV